MKTDVQPQLKKNPIKSEMDFVAQSRHQNKNKVDFLVRLKGIMEQRAQSLKHEIIRLNGENEMLMEKYYRLSDKMKTLG